MFKPVLLAAALLAATATPALADDIRTFTRDGLTYAYTQTVHGDRTHIDGNVVSSGAPFHLTIRDGRVTGMVDDVPVSFSVSETHAKASQREFASR